MYQALFHLVLSQLVVVGCRMDPSISDKKVQLQRDLSIVPELSMIDINRLEAPNLWDSFGKNHLN